MKNNEPSVHPIYVEANTITVKKQRSVSYDCAGNICRRGNNCIYRKVMDLFEIHIRGVAGIMGKEGERGRIWCEGHGV